VLEGPTAVAGARRDLSGVAGLLAPQRTAARSAAPTVPAQRSPVVARSATPTPAPTVVPTPSGPPPATPGPAATAVPLTAPGYSCDAQSGGGGGGQGILTTARVGAQKGYDRFVVQFDGAVPQFSVQLQDGPTLGGVTLQGAVAIAVVLRGASAGGSFSGPSDLVPSFGTLREARLLSDSQGVVQWGIGIARPACFHAWVLSGPSRLVVDIVD
jgi:hypothetical protein